MSEKLTFVRKNTQLLIAYTALLIGSVGTVCYETNRRSLIVQPLSEAEQKAALRRQKGITATRVITAPTTTVVEPATEPAPVKGTQLPRGVFLVKDTMSLRSTEGRNCELTAGTEVTLLRREKGKMKISHDGDQFLVEENQITRNVLAMSKGV